MCKCRYKAYIVGILGLGVIGCLGTEGIREYKVRKQPEYVAFANINKDIEVSTGLIKDEKVEKKLNRAGIYDSEIRKLKKKELTYLNECEGAKAIKVDIDYCKYNESNGKLMRYDIDDIHYLDDICMMIYYKTQITEGAAHEKVIFNIISNTAILQQQPESV